MDVKKLIKLSLHMDYTCQPIVDIVYYEDQITEDGYVYMNQEGEGARIKNKMIKPGCIWSVINFYQADIFNYYMIVENNNLNNEQVADQLKKIYDEVINSRENIKKQFASNLDALQMPSQYDLIELIKHKFSTTNVNKYVYTLSKSDFIKILMSKIQELSDELAEINNINKKHWDIYYNATVNMYIIETLLDGFKKALKFKGDNVEFQNEETFNLNVKNIAGAISMSLLNKFKEDY